MLRLKKTFRRLVALIALFSLELLIVLGIFLGSLFIFYLVWQKNIELKQNHFDHAVFNALRPFYSPGRTEIIKGITFLASFQFLVVLCSLILVFFLFIKRHHWYSLKIAVVATGSLFLNLLLKATFSRPRPLLPLVFTTGFSFPSGHSMAAFSIYGLLIYIAWREIPNKILRYGICLALLLLIHLIGFSRIYLRVHFASDVIAGFATGAVWLIGSVAVLRLIERFSKRKLDPIVKS